MATKTPKHKVFISFHEKDMKRKEEFVRMMGKRIVDTSVDTGNIDDTGLKTATVRQKIRDEYIRDATVTIVPDRSSHVATQARGLGRSGRALGRPRRILDAGCWESYFPITPIMGGKRTLTLT